MPSAAPLSEKPGSKSDPTKTSVRSEAEPERKIIEIEETRHHQDECATSYTALEQKVQSLQDDKRAFEELVATLQEKIRHLEVPDEWEESSGYLEERGEEEREREREEEEQEREREEEEREREREEEEREREEERKREREEKRENVLCIIETVFRVASIAMVILVTELTIAWNKIQGVNDTKSVGQLIPLMIGVGGIGHVLLEATRKAIRKATREASRGSTPVDGIVQEHSPDEPFNITCYIAAHEERHNTACSIASFPKKTNGERLATWASDMLRMF
jgi:cation transport ATPase